MLPTTLLNLLAVCLLPLDTPSVTALHTARSPADALRILSKREGECKPGSSPCNKAGLPANFCCPSDQQCIVFNNNKSTICCPKDQDCKKIQPISCDISKQNATAAPGSGIHSTDLAGSLQKCADKCCPRGYSCQNNDCVLQAPSSTSSSAVKSSSTASSTSSPTRTSASPTNTALSGSNSTSSAAQCKQFPAGAVVAGLVPGIVLGILLTIAVILILGRRNKKNPPQKSNASIFSSVGPSISDPMPHYQQNGELRNDFLRRDPYPTDTNTNATAGGYGRSRASSRVRSLFSRSPTYNRHNQYPPTSTDGIGRSLQTPMQTPNIRREPSTESIKIYSPPNDHLGRDNASEHRPGTTFTQMASEFPSTPSQ